MGECQEFLVVALVDGSKKLSGMGNKGGRLDDSMKPMVGRQPIDKGVEATAMHSADARVVPLAAAHLHGCVHHDLYIYCHHFFLYYCDDVGLFSVHSKASIWATIRTIKMCKSTSGEEGGASSVGGYNGLLGLAGFFKD